MESDGSPASWEPIAAYVRAQRDALAAHDPRVRAAEPDAAHKMRVACRRLRSTLRTFGPYLDRAAADSVRAELRWLAGELAPYRDNEVLAATVGDALGTEPVALQIGPVADRVEAHFESEARRTQAKALAALDDERYGALIGAVDELAVASPVKPTDGARLLGRVGKAVRRLDRRLDRVAALADDAERTTALHDARKVGKRARYAVEALRTVGGKDAERLIRALKRLQDVLGAHHDSVNAEALLLDLSSRARSAGESEFTYGLLYARVHTAGQDALADLPAATEALQRPDARGWLVR